MNYPNPTAWEICPTLEDVKALTQRRWKLRVFEKSASKIRALQNAGAPNIIVEAEVNLGIFQRARSDKEARNVERDSEGTGESGPSSPHFVRCRNLAQVRLLVAADVYFPFLAIRGGVGIRGAEYLRTLGFAGFALVDRAVHDVGGPIAEGLDYSTALPDAFGSTLELHAIRDCAPWQDSFRANGGNSASNKAFMP